MKSPIIVAALALATLAPAAPARAGDGGRSQPAPPGAPPFSFEEWMVRYQAWYLKGGLPASDHVGRVRFLTQPQGDPIPVVPGSPVVVYTGRLDLTLAPRSPLVVPILSLNGESYAGDVLPPDEPLDFYADSLLGAEVRVTLDGQVLLDSAVDDLAGSFFGPAYFHAPIAYRPPQYRFTDPALGDVYADAALWTEGLGLILPPLPAGRHTLKVRAVNYALGYGFDNTWEITVAP